MLFGKPEFYSLNTYGSFESSIYKHLNPKEYFNSSDWKDIVHLKITEALATSNPNKKNIFEDLINNFLDNDLQFFGDLSLLEKFKEKNKDIVLDMFKLVKFDLIQYNLSNKSNISMDIEDFDEFFDEVVLDLMAQENKLGVENIYKDINITLYFNTDNKHNILDTEFCLLENSYLLLDDRIIDLFDKLRIGQEDVSHYYEGKGENYQELNDFLKEGDHLDYEHLTVFGGNADTGFLSKVPFNSIMENIADKNKFNIPVFMVSSSVEDILNSKFDKSGSLLNVENLGLSLALITDKDKVIKLADLNPKEVLKKGYILAEDVSEEFPLDKSVKFIENVFQRKNKDMDKVASAYTKALKEGKVKTMISKPKR